MNINIKLLNAALIICISLCCNLVLANGNTVSGEINLMDKDGSAKKYRSDVVVFLEQVGTKQSFEAAPKDDIVISQRGRKFRPSVVPILKGTALVFPNDDRVLHNVFSLSKMAPFDLGNYAQHESRSVTITHSGLVTVYCNMHPAMQLDVLVLDNPYFAKTKQDGLYAIENVPDGDYILRVWHELSEEINKPVTLKGGEIQQHNFDMQLTKIRAEHDNKYGKPYRGKY